MKKCVNKKSWIKLMKGQKSLDYSVAKSKVILELDRCSVNHIKVLLLISSMRANKKLNRLKNSQASIDQEQQRDLIQILVKEKERIVGLEKSAIIVREGPQALILSATIRRQTIIALGMMTVETIVAMKGTEDVIALTLVSVSMISIEVVAVEAEVPQGDPETIVIVTVTIGITGTKNLTTSTVDCR